MRLSATSSFEAMALGGSTRTTVDAKVTAIDRAHVGTAAVDARAAASGDTLATTAITGSVYGEGDDGSGVLVETTTEGVAVGDDAYSTSITTSFVITTKGADVGFGLCSSTASGDTYEDAYASTAAYGDITAGHSVDTDTADLSRALSVGIAVDLA
jgi:hypothetical protein